MDSRKKHFSPPSHWLRGHAKEIFKDPIHFTAQAALKFGPVCQLRIYQRKILVTADAEMVNRIFLTETKNFRKGGAYRQLRLLGGQGLITSEGAHWKRQRRIAQPAFHKEKIDKLLQSFIDESEALSSKWESYSSLKSRPISTEMSRLTLEVIGKTLFSTDLYKESASVPKGVKSVLKFLNKRNYSFPRFPISWPLPSHISFKSEIKRLEKVVYKIIDARIARKTSGNDLLQMFVDAVDKETGEKMSRKEIRDEVFTMFLAGFETSSVALTWVWYLLSENKEVYKKFIQELKKVIPNGPVTPRHLSQLPYTKQIIEETLRLYSPVFTIARETSSDLKINGMDVKENTLILTSLIGLHRNPKYWKNPLKFDPERFSEKNKKNMVKNSYIPFGSGNRICIGQQFAIFEMIAVLAVLGRKYYCSPKSGYEPKTVAAITTNVTEGMPMHIHRITTSE